MLLVLLALPELWHGWRRSWLASFSVLLQPRSPRVPGALPFSLHGRVASEVTRSRCCVHGVPFHHALNHAPYSACPYSACPYSPGPCSAPCPGADPDGWCDLHSISFCSQSGTLNLVLVAPLRARKGCGPAVVLLVVDDDTVAAAAVSEEERECGRGWERGEGVGAQCGRGGRGRDEVDEERGGEGKKMQW